MHKPDAQVAAISATGHSDGEHHNPTDAHTNTAATAQSEVPIFALPEHQVIEALLPQLAANVLDVDSARQRLRDNPQLVPVALNPHSGLLHFADLGDHRYQEWQHIYTMQQLALAGGIASAFSVAAELLDGEALLPDVRSPRGFILHVSRCGSTLLGKALARADGLAVINQPAVLQHGFWAWISDNWQRQSSWEPQHDARNQRRFRNLMHLLCRQRRPDEQQVFIKFISWNTLYADFIHACFPATPMLYMYRDPVEVIASVQRETTAILLARQSAQAMFLSNMDAATLAAMDDVEYLAACYAHGFARILDTTAAAKMLNYAGFKPDTFARVLAAAFALEPTAEQLQQMLQQFQVYSKDDQNQTTFKDDSERKRSALSAAQIDRIRQHCEPGWQQLLAHPHNIIA
ncbi:MAG: hypothetical protein KKC01_05620 [Gammaproteobacteria bacterium]|nr:hypothetical protein [Gammaproteobacteria bacterium]